MRRRDSLMGIGSFPRANACKPVSDSTAGALGIESASFPLGASLGSILSGAREACRRPPEPVADDSRRMAGLASPRR
jgi:hypothetical protein